MKRVWISRKFSYIYEASPSTNLAFFMQSLYAHSIGTLFRVLAFINSFILSPNPPDSEANGSCVSKILNSCIFLHYTMVTLMYSYAGYMIGNASLSHRLGGLYCLYCLYETQPFKPPFKIYLSLGELKKLTNLVVDVKEKGLKVVSALIRRMLEKNMFLFGSVEINEGSVTETVNQLTELQNACIQVAYKKLLANTRMEHFIHMDLGKEVDLNVVQKMSTEYAEAKKVAIEETSKVADVQDIKHVAEDKNLIGDAIEQIANDWIVQREIFYRQTRSSQHPPEEPQQLLLLQQREEEQLQGDEDFDQELERLLSES